MDEAGYATLKSSFLISSSFPPHKSSRGARCAPLFFIPILLPYILALDHLTFNHFVCGNLKGVKEHVMANARVLEEIKSTGF